jgi:hypothetical protein
MNFATEVKNAIETLQRLNKVIDFLEGQQQGNYNPIFELVLSYLRDVRDASVPDYVMQYNLLDQSASKEVM